MTPEERNLIHTLEALIEAWRKEARKHRMPPTSTIQQAKANVYENCANGLRAVIGSPT